MLRRNVFNVRRQLEVSAMKHIVHVGTGIAKAFVQVGRNEVTPKQNSCRHLNP